MTGEGIAGPKKPMKINGVEKNFEVLAVDEIRV